MTNTKSVKLFFENTSTGVQSVQLPVGGLGESPKANKTRTPTFLIQFFLLVIN